MTTTLPVPQTAATPDTPMMNQWRTCKAAAPVGTLLFFRLGDFYEAFGDDAVIISRELDLTLTERQGVKMCGVPHMTATGAIERLVAKGHRVAVADQVEDPIPSSGGKKLLKREIAHLYSPGTIIGSSLLPETTSNYIACGHLHDNRYGFACVDVTTGSFLVYEGNDRRELLNELWRLKPSEIVVAKQFCDRGQEFLHELSSVIGWKVQVEEDYRFRHADAEAILRTHWHIQTIDGFGISTLPTATICAGALLGYLNDNHVPTAHLRPPSPIRSHHTMLLDRATITNLELLEPLTASSTTLFNVLNETVTAMGARLLRGWIAAPLSDPEAIASRQEAVQELLWFLQREKSLAQHLHNRLSLVKDLERLIGRIQTGHFGPRDYLALKVALEQFPGIQSTLQACASNALYDLATDVVPLHEITDLLNRALVETPPLRVTDGGLFRAGFSPELDEVMTLKNNAREWLAGYEERLRTETGIRTLKVGFTRIFGYFIEVGKAHLERVPPTFQRRQTVATGERYTTPELAAFEEKITSSEERIQHLEAVLFRSLQERIAPHYAAISTGARALARLDVFFSLAKVACRRNYVRPTVQGHPASIEIENGRHPVIEALPATTHFTPNGIHLDGSTKSLMLLTGPNMGGKSTYIRQVALIVIMAHMGSFVPATKATMGIVDKLFSRIGASDDLARGQSTFMVEMTETASILNQVTDRSLVILDEIGRGTGTYDGMAIAWSVAEFLLNTPHKQSKTLFATHYHELAALEQQHPRATNCTVAIAETHAGIQFLHKIIAGSANKSYGIFVAEIAGMPVAVTQRARELLAQLERKS